MAARRRGFETVADMGRSLGVTLLFVVVLVGVVAIGRSDPDPAHKVDYRSVLEQARRVAPYPVLAPATLSEGWYANGVDYDASSSGTTWHLGLVTPDGEYLGLDQSNGDVDRFVDELLVGYQPDGTSTVSGQTWDRRRETGDRVNDRALVRVADGVVTIVVGTGTYPQIEAFVDSLR